MYNFSDLRKHNIVLMQNNFLDKREKTDSEEDNVVMIFMNSFNAIYAFTTLQMKIILIMRTYYKNNKN